MTQDLLDLGNQTANLQSIKTFAGKQAGMCYAKEKYRDSYISDYKKASGRFDRVSGTGHHSIADHSQVTLLIEDCPKMTAMLLNSLGLYTTSEKSGRYTKMTAAGVEDKLYKKWYDIFFELILTRYPDIDSKSGGDSLRDKLAKENARYVLSVFYPATDMTYTTSIRQINYIIDWCQRYIVSRHKDTEFNKRLLLSISDLYDKLNKLGLYCNTLRDTKQRRFNFLSDQTNFGIDKSPEILADSYLIKYSVSFADLAQEQRHRTLDYFMCYSGDTFEFYVPKILTLDENEQFKKEWLEDLDSIKYSYPIATLVDVVETGLVSNFVMKCDERLCGRVMLETYENIRNNIVRLALSENLSEFGRQQLSKHYDFQNDKLLMKCANIKCKEPCIWGPLSAQKRYI